jgi:hypothetical protein
MLDEKLINELIAEAKEKFARQAEDYKQKADRFKLYQKLMKELVNEPFNEEVQNAVEKGKKITEALLDEIWVKYKPIIRRITNAVYG